MHQQIHVYNEFIDEKPSRDPVQEQMIKIDCGVPGPSANEITELLQLNRDGYLPMSSFPFS